VEFDDIEKSEKLYHNINEVASALKVTPATLRFWESEFSQLKIRKSGKGNRLYKQEDIILLKNIHHLLKEKGYKIEGAKKILSRRKDSVPDKFTLISKLEHVKTFLRELKKDL